MGGGILWEKKSLGPGPTKLIGGNEEAGFYGEVPTSELITGDELSRRIGLNAGTSQYSNEPWLKFSYMGNIEFIAKKPIRYSISWLELYDTHIVFGKKIIKINNQEYKVRLIKGKSEWDRLFPPLCGYSEPKWNVKYTNRDLITHYWSGSGSYTWCQENGDSTDSKLCRGYEGVMGSIDGNPSDRGYDYGWRPVLELID